jgi:Domain of unknown function (DUF5666)
MKNPRQDAGKITLAIISLFMTLCMSGCGGGGDTQASTTLGQITGFGSVIVNGIRFTRKGGLADDRVKLWFENNTSAGEESLRVGMIVTIKGAVNTAAGIGEYESIEFLPEIRGPLDDNGVDLANNRVTVMGWPIQVGADTSFENFRDLADLHEDLQAKRHPELEISGNLDGVGTLHATRIAYKAEDFITGIAVIKGKIATASVAGGAASGSFTIGGVTVNFATTALGPDTGTADIAPGTLVEVRGALKDAVVTAFRVAKPRAVSDALVNDHVVVKGIAVGGVTDDTFGLAGPNGTVTVATGGASFVKGGGAAASDIVRAGASLEVEGSLRGDGSIAAGRVSIAAERNFKLEGNAAAAGAFNATTGILTLNGVPVTVTATTRLIDQDDDAGHPLQLSSIVAGNHLRIDGMVDGTAYRFTASQVQRTIDGVISSIQGPVTAFAIPKLTLMGAITVDTSAIGQAASFRDNRTGEALPFAGRDAFFAALTADGLTVVKAMGTGSAPAMDATDVEIEMPP